MKDQLQQIIREIAGRSLDDISLKTDFVEDIQFESIEMIDLMIKVEREFHLKFTEDDLDMSNFRTFGALLNLLESKTTPSGEP